MTGMQAIAAMMMSPAMTRCLAVNFQSRQEVVIVMMISAGRSLPTAGRSLPNIHGHKYTYTICEPMKITDICMYMS